MILFVFVIFSDNMKQQSQPPQAIPSKKLVNCSNPKTMGNFYVSGVVSFVIFLYITAIYLAWMVKMPCKKQKNAVFLKFFLKSECRNRVFFAFRPHFSVHVFVVLYAGDYHGSWTGSSSLGIFFCCFLLLF